MLSVQAVAAERLLRGLGALDQRQRVVRHDDPAQAVEEREAERW